MFPAQCTLHTSVQCTYSVRRHSMFSEKSKDITFIDVQTTLKDTNMNQNLQMEGHLKLRSLSL